MNKKIVIIGICLVAICLLILSYNVFMNNKNSNDGELNLNKNEVEQINISFFPSFYKDAEVTNEDQINKIVDYLNSLNTIETTENPSQYAGGGYTIKIHLRDGTDRELLLSGNKFFAEQDRFLYEITYDEAIRFNIIFANIHEDNEEKNGNPSITGTVVSVVAEESGRNLSCIIKDNNNETYNINVENANIMCSTGDGWLILHENDEVRVFYEKDKKKNNGEIIASIVFIKTTAQ